MITGYEGYKFIVNKYGINVPISMIFIDQELKKTVKSKLTDSTGTEDERRQKLFEEYFTEYKRVTGKEHEANLCKNDNDVWRMYMSHKYEHIKAMVHRSRNGYVDIFDDPKDLQYYGAKIIPSYDGGLLNMEDSMIDLYRVDPAFHYEHGLQREFITFKNLEDISKIISNIPTKMEVPHAKI